MTNDINFPENVKNEEHIKEFLAEIYKEIGAISYKIQKENQIDVYFPRIDILSILYNYQIKVFIKRKEKLLC